MNLCFTISLVNHFRNVGPGAAERQAFICACGIPLTDAEDAKTQEMGAVAAAATA